MYVFEREREREVTGLLFALIEAEMKASHFSDPDISDPINPGPKPD